MLNSSICLIDRILSGSSQSETGNNGYEGVLHIPQSSKTGASPSDDVMSYPEHSMGESYTSAVMQTVYFAAPIDWTPLILSSLY